MVCLHVVKFEGGGGAGAARGTTAGAVNGFGGVGGDRFHRETLVHGTPSSISLFSNNFFRFACARRYCLIYFFRDIVTWMVSWRRESCVVQI